MLDRGQLKDWFSSTEIWIEAIVAAVAFYLFVIHMLTTTEQRFVSPALFKDRNFPHRQCVHVRRRGSFCLRRWRCCRRCCRTCSTTPS